MNNLTRMDVLRKCITVFEAIRRMSSKGNAGLEAAPGAEASFQLDDEIVKILKEWIREMEETGPVKREAEEQEQPAEVRDWQTEIMENGPPPNLFIL